MAVFGVIPLETKAWWVCFTERNLPCSAQQWAFCFNFSLLWLVPNLYRQFLCQGMCPVLIQSNTITIRQRFLSGALKFCCIYLEHLVWCSFLSISPILFKFCEVWWPKFKSTKSLVTPNIIAHLLCLTLSRLASLALVMHCIWWKFNIKCWHNPW